MDIGLYHLKDLAVVIYECDVVLHFKDDFIWLISSALVGGNEHILEKLINKVPF